MRHIETARANRDFTITVTWREGGEDTIDMRPLLFGVFEPLLSDVDAFVGDLEIVFDGYAIGWPEDRHFSADSLWYRAHPEEYARDYPEEAARASRPAAA